MALYEKANATNPFLTKADKLMANNMPKEAVSEYLKSVLKENKNIKTHLGLSKAYKELEEYDKAIKHLENAKKYAAFDYEIYYELGLNHLLNSDFDLAGKNFRKTIKLNPNFLDAQVQLGIAHEMMDETRMALQIYDKIIEEEPNYVLAYHHKAGLLMSLNDFEEAARIFFDILKIDDTYSKAYLGLAICLDKLEKYTNAVRFYKKYIVANPKSETVRSIASRIIDIVNATKDHSSCNLRIAK